MLSPKTISPQRLAANRRNALKSTGPRTAPGKAASSCNSLKTGLGSNRLLLPNESPEELARVAAAWRRTYPDAIPAESSLIDTLIHCYWLCHRLAGIESDLKAQEKAAAHSANPFGLARRSRVLRAAAQRNDQFIRLNRRRETLTRDFHNAENELIELRAARLSQPFALAQPQQNETSATPAGLIVHMTPLNRLMEPA